MHAQWDLHGQARQLVQAATMILSQVDLDLPLYVAKACFLCSCPELVEALLEGPDWPFDESFLASAHRDLGGGA
eukprot:4213750-Pyramimonas_sp.AAC.1